MRVIRSASRVRVPATSGNLGPGFDCLGMAHPVWDEVSCELIAGPSTVEIIGEGAHTLPRDESHLIIQAMKRTLDVSGLAHAGIALRCTNNIAQGRGLGSSAAAVVAGILLVKGLVDEPELITGEVALAIACEFEGHPDNAAPALWGGAVASWTDAQGAHALSLNLSPQLSTTLLVPNFDLPTSQARAALPAQVPHQDAAFNLSRTALMIKALEGASEYFMEASRDRLHQEYRRSSMPETMRTIDALREAGWPAVVSGAGPSILVFAALDAVTAQILADRGWQVRIGKPAGPAEILPFES